MRGRLQAGLSIAALAAAGTVGLASFVSAQPSENPNSFLVGRGQYRFYSCAQLANIVATNENRQRELLALIAKAKQGPGGGLVSMLSYEPDLAVARGQLAEVRREQAEKKCPPGAGFRPPAPDPPARRR